MGIKQQMVEQGIVDEDVLYLAELEDQMEAQGQDTDQLAMARQRLMEALNLL